MTFNHTLENVACDCLNGAAENTTDEFFRLLKPIKDELSPDDFLSNYELGIKPKSENCKDICSNRGVSVVLSKNGNIQEIYKFFGQLFSFNPKRKRYAAKCKFSKDAGVVKQEGWKYHHNLYKSDQYTFDKISVLELIDIQEHV